VGYHLIGAGRRQMEDAVGYRPKFSKWVRRLVLAHPTPTYLTPIAVVTAALLLGVAGSASARDFGDRVDHRLDRKGDHIEQRLDQKGNRIEARYDRRATSADSHGHERLANHLEARGNRINARLDRKGQRADNRLDRRGDRFDHRWDRRH